jgi:hypothetical protein
MSHPTTEPSAWRDDAADAEQCATIDLAWVGLDHDGEVVFHTDVTITSAEFAIMLNALADHEEATK